MTLAKKTALVAISRKRAIDPTGRLDLLGLRVFNRLLDGYGGPALKAVMKTLAPEVENCFRENLGPRSRAGKAAKNLVAAVHEEQRGRRL